MPLMSFSVFISLIHYYDVSIRWPERLCGIIISPDPAHYCHHAILKENAASLLL